MAMGEPKTEGAHLRRLREAAASADRGEGISLTGLTREERRKLLARGVK